MNNDDNWRTPNFRQNIISKIEEAMQSSAMPTNKSSSEMESHVFNKAKNKEEYLGYVARLILHVRDMNNPNQNQKKMNMQATQSDPMNALRAMTQPGTPGQMMNMSQQGGPPQQINPASNPIPAPHLPIPAYQTHTNYAEAVTRVQQELMDELNRACGRMDLRENDEHSFLARTWANELEKMRADQREIKENAIQAFSMQPRMDQ